MKFFRSATKTILILRENGYNKNCITTKLCQLKHKSVGGSGRPMLFLVFIVVYFFVFLYNKIMKNEMEKIIELIRKNKDNLKNAYNIEKIGIFGSFAREDQNRLSDIDILVEFSEPIGYFKFIELERFLEKVLGKKVDLATKNSLKLSIKEEVLKDTIYA